MPLRQKHIHTEEEQHKESDKKADSHATRAHGVGVLGQHGIAHAPDVDSTSPAHANHHYNHIHIPQPQGIRLPFRLDTIAFANAQAHEYARRHSGDSNDPVPADAQCSCAHVIRPIRLRLHALLAPAGPNTVCISPETMHQAGRLWALLGSLLIAISAGSTYVFSSYAPQLQTALHLSSTQLNVLGLAGNMGMYMSGPLWGRWIDQSGPHGAVLAGAFLVLSGYGVVSRAYKYEWQNMPVAVLAIFCMLTGLGNSAGNNAAINVQAKNWTGTHRGSAMALVLSAFGLSAFVYSTLSHVFFSGNVTGYLDLLALGSFGCFLTGMSLLKVIPPTQEEIHAEATRHHADYRRVPDEDHEAHQSRPWPKHLSRLRSSSETSARVIAWIRDVAEAEETVDDEDTDDDENEEENPYQENIAGWALVKNVDFLLLFAILGLVSGSGLLLINNVGMITHVLYDYAHRQDKQANALTQMLLLLIKGGKGHEIQRIQALQVSCISLGNALGRIVIGIFSDMVVLRTKQPTYRTYLIIPVVVLATISQGLFALPNVINSVEHLMLVSCLTGLMYGTLFGLFPVLVFEWFGMQSFSQNWGWSSFAPVIFGNVYNLLFGVVYDSNVPNEGHSHKCLKGEECYRSVFIVTTLGCFVSIVACFILLWRRVHGFSDRVKSLFSRSRLAIE